MSTFGGDSWVPEIVYRKRRVEELLGEEIQVDEVRRLSNGRLACLVCPHVPVLDTLPVLQIHRKGARHQAAAEKQREKEKRLHEEIQKRIALGSSSVPSTDYSSISTPAFADIRKKTSPLLAAIKNVKAAVLLGQVDGSSEATELPGNTSLDNEVRPYVRKKGDTFFESQTENSASSKKADVGVVHVSPQSLPERTHESRLKHTKPKGIAKSAISQKRAYTDGPGIDSAQDLTMQELHKAKERELRWREAGWRRDGVGGWFRDENVEFDSDEDTPVSDAVIYHLHTGSNK